VLTKKVWERIQKNGHFKTASIHFETKVKKVWERRSYAFPPHYTPATNHSLNTTPIAYDFKPVEQVFYKSFVTYRVIEFFQTLLQLLLVNFFLRVCSYFTFSAYVEMT